MKNFVEIVKRLLVSQYSTRPDGNVKKMTVIMTGIM